MRGAVRRVHDFEMELRGVEFALRRRRSWRSAHSARCRSRAKPVGQLGDAVAVAHPHRIALRRPPRRRRSAATASSSRPRRGRIRGDGRPRPCRRAAPPWPARRSRCRAPARRPDRSPSARAARPCSSTEAGPPERMTPFGFIARECRFRLLKRHDLAIDPLLAHAPRDQLRHLRAEIDDENLVVGRHSGFYARPALPRQRRRLGSGLSSIGNRSHAARRSRLTKNPSVSVRRGVISNPSPEISAARRKKIGALAERLAISAGFSTEKSGRRSTKARDLIAVLLRPAPNR